MSDTENQSKTLDTPSGTFELDQGDQAGGENQPFRLPRIRVGTDADELQAALDAKLYGLPASVQRSLTIPSAAEQSAEALQGDANESLRGTPQDQIEVARLSERVTHLTAQAAKLHGRGASLPAQLANELTAAKNSLDFQLSRMRATTPDPAVEQFNSDRNLMLESYKNDMGLAVNAMMKEEQVDKATAIGLVEKQIAVFGADNILPRFSRIEQRMLRKYPQSN